MEILKTPTINQIQVAIRWLSQAPHHNPDLEYVLNLMINGRPVLQDQGELVVIAHTASTLKTLLPGDICGVLIASSGNTNVSLVGGDRLAAEALLSLVQPRGCPQRVTTSSLTRDWIRPHLVRDYQVIQEHHPFIMHCTSVPIRGSGRWAKPADKPALEASFVANQAERTVKKTMQPDWDTLIQQKRVAVLECDGQIASIVRRGTTADHGLVIGAFTFAPFRRRGFAKQLLAFLTCELLQDYPVVKLWVDEDNWGAISLYQSLGFQTVYTFYTGYFKERD